MLSYDEVVSGLKRMTFDPPITLSEGDLYVYCEVALDPDTDAQNPHLASASGGERQPISQNPHLRSDAHKFNTGSWDRNEDQRAGCHSVPSSHGIPDPGRNKRT